MNDSHLTLKSYVLGFIFSLVFTLSAYWLVTSGMSSHFILTAIMILAFLQLITQLIFFLHLGKGKKNSFSLFIFFTTIIGIFILVVGSMWIMNHLNTRMTSQDMTKYLIKDEGIGK